MGGLFNEGIDQIFFKITLCDINIANMYKCENLLKLLKIPQKNPLFQYKEPVFKQCKYAQFH